MAAALLRLATDHHLRQRLGAGALRKAAAYDVTTIGDRWIEIYQGAVAGRRSGEEAGPEAAGRGT